MKNSLLLLVTLVAMHVKGQELKTTEIQLLDSGFIEVLSVLPDSFPSVELVVRVTNSIQEPIWNLDTSGFYVTEGSTPSQVTSVRQISKDKPINIAMILDESGSMDVDESQLYDSRGRPLYKYNFYGGIVYPKGYVAPINSLKTAARTFISGFNFSKDSISLVTFSTEINRIIPAGSTEADLKRRIRQLEAEGATAFYDAINEGLNQLKTSAGLKVLVAITDGRDNSSSNGFNEVILKAQLQEVPLHIIGIGGVNQDSLLVLATQTGGSYYYSKNARGLEEVYERVKSNIQSIYGLVYESENFNPADTSRNVVVQYTTDSSYAAVDAELLLPEEVVTYLQERKNSRLLYTSIGVGLAIGFAGFLILYRRKDQKNVA